MRLPRIGKCLSPSELDDPPKTDTPSMKSSILEMLMEGYDWSNYLGGSSSRQMLITEKAETNQTHLGYFFIK